MSKIENTVLNDPPLSKKRLSNLYSPHFLKLLQFIYGSEGIISQGGIESVDLIFSGMNLNNKKILDVGSGYGGVDTYLARQYSADIIGVDKELYMINRSQELLAQVNSVLKGKVTFQTLSHPTSLKEFSEETFDLVYSKEMLYHVPVADKQNFIHEMYRVLKPGGTLIIADWMQGTPILGECLKRALRVDGFCHFVTPQSLQTMMQNAKCCSINFRDQSKEHIRYSMEDLARLKKAEHQVRQELGDDTYNTAFDSWTLWLKAQQSCELLSGILSGRKPLSV